MIAELVYVLCMLTSLFCAYLLLRSYAANRSRLLLWSTVCFVGLAISNALLVVDFLVFSEVDLRLLRNGVSLGAGVALAVGLIWEMR
jgi:hypothetical protein